MIKLPSLLDNDFYKFTMQNGVIKLFPRAKAKYEFINRGKHRFPPGFAAALREAVDNMSLLKLTTDEKQFLAKNCPFLDPTYLDFLQGYCYNPDEVIIRQTEENLQVSIEGYWYRAILWEVPLMALISELYYQLVQAQPESDKTISEKTKAKIEKYTELGVSVADFGTRRRHSFHVHSLVVETLKKFGGKTFVGTSNVYLAFLNKTKPIGTHAHEWFMFHAAKYGFKMANAVALENWTNVYRGDLGIALSDTYTTEAFFQQFDKKFSKLFDGVRHDSGDPVEFAQKTIKHYSSLGIDPSSKTIIFSDALNYEKVKKIAAFCAKKIGMSFGIGTNLTNDVGLNPLNIVIKMTEALPEDQQWQNVIKLSDEPGKHTGNLEAIALAKKILNIE
ncbi:nicotinate phosphoribosyltransferase [Pedobacter sp. SYSU D00535]|uniref:nicotinate phosphoribosyltransferase n=1 Tax=Pedobacter sp. SYSU D00535 TaxID=2810308 RepID=UPI001A9634EF